MNKCCLQFMKLFIPECSLDLVLEILARNFLILMWVIKYITFSSVMENVKQIRKRVQSNWSVLVDYREIDIMQKCTNVGRRFTIGILICVYSGTFGFTLVQYIPDLLDVLMPLNESRPRILLYQTNYFINQQKYFYIILIHDIIGLLLSGTTGIAAETYSLVNAIHAFGMFRIARYRMEHMLRIDVSQIPIAKSYIIFHHKITAAVDVHRRALDFSELLKQSFGIGYLFMVVAAICSATVTLFRLFRIITMQQDKIEVIKLVCYMIFLFLFLVISNFVGEEFTNCDNDVHRTICNTKWYNAPLKIQKFILFLLRKTVKGYKVDAGGLFSPCLESLATAMSLLLSFLTILCSIQ